MVEAALDALEFRLREMNTGRYPRGLAMSVAALSTWLYGGDPLAALRYETPIAAVKAALARGERYFENLIQTRLLDNPHRVEPCCCGPIRPCAPARTPPKATGWPRPAPR